MTGRRLSGYVHVTDPDTGESFAFGPDVDVPKWAASRITNPAAWAEAPAVATLGDGDQKVDDSTGGQSSAPEPPPQGGPGSSEAAWRVYAGSLDVALTDDMDRAGVIVAVEAAGFPV